MTEVIDRIIPAYPFVQYNDDENVVAFFNAYNTLAQQYLDALNGLALPCWTSPEVTGYLLDWIAQGIYGQLRPAVQLSQTQTEKGDYNTIEYNMIPYACISNYVAGQYAFLSDDLFKRILTWNFYKGDGFQFSVPWLKRRVARFIHGKDGLDPPLQQTFDVSIKPSSGSFHITLPEYGDGIARSLASSIAQGFVKLPFIYTYQTEIKVMS